MRKIQKQVVNFKRSDLKIIFASQVNDEKCKLINIMMFIKMRITLKRIGGEKFEFKVQ